MNPKTDTPEGKGRTLMMTCPDCGWRGDVPTEWVLSERGDIPLLPSRDERPRGNWNPNETPSELEARLAKIKEFVDAVNKPDDKQETPVTDAAVAALHRTGWEGLADIARRLEHELAAMRSRAEAAESNWQSAEAECAELSEKLKEAPSATLPSPALLEKALTHALNYHNVDARTSTADFELAAKLMPQIMQWVNEHKAHDIGEIVRK